MKTASGHGLTDRTDTTPASSGTGKRRIAGEAPQPALRNRLLARIAGLLLVLAALVLVFLLNSAASMPFPVRALIGVTLFACGAGLLWSVYRLASSERPADPAASSLHGTRADSTGDLRSPGAALAGNRQGVGVARYNERELEEKSLQILYEVVSSINTANDLDDLLSRFLYTLKRITYAQAAAIWVLRKGGGMELSACSGLDNSLVTPERLDVRRCLYERAATEGKIWVEQDLKKFEKIAGQKFFERDDIGLVSIPMRYRGMVSGVINLFLEVKLIEQIDSLKPLLTSIAHHLSIAVEKSQSDEERCRHMISEERTRIAHDLHDSLAQTLATLRLQVRVLDEILHQGDESASWQQLEKIELNLEDANTDLRGLIGNFRAPGFKLGLVDSIQQIVNQFRSESHIRTYFQKEWNATSLPRDIQTQILRIIQEALWNIRKHSEAKTVRIMLKNNHGGKCHILIEDDGIGIREQAHGTPGEHIGLTIMRERAARIGGRLRIESEHGEGTRVVLELNQNCPNGQTP